MVKEGSLPSRYVSPSGLLTLLPHRWGDALIVQARALLKRAFPLLVPCSLMNPEMMPAVLTEMRVINLLHKAKSLGLSVSEDISAYYFAFNPTVTRNIMLPIIVIKREEIRNEERSSFCFLVRNRCIRRTRISPSGTVGTDGEPDTTKQAII